MPKIKTLLSYAVVGTALVLIGLDIKDFLLESANRSHLTSAELNKLTIPLAKVVEELDELSDEDLKSLTSVIDTSPTEKSIYDLALEEYQIWSLSHRKAAFQAHLLKDNILFTVVLIVVGFGLYFSYIQFKKGKQSEGSLKLGQAGIEVKSSVLGIFILVFSTGFLYLYLVHVFPIVEVGSDTLPPQITDSN